MMDSGAGHSLSSPLKAFPFTETEGLKMEAEIHHNIQNKRNARSGQKHT